MIRPTFIFNDHVQIAIVTIATSIATITEQI